LNIFYLSKNPTQAAQWMVDRHCVKMILESAQLLSTAHRVIDGIEAEEIRINVETGKSRKVKMWILPDERQDKIYSATHINHPSAIWIRQSIENYNWLVDHFHALMDEYTFRYGKVHKSKEMSSWISSPPYNLKIWEATPIICAMDEKYIISNDPVENYQNYYINGKSHLFKWTKRDKPSWIP
jgi:hypothetical protein